MKRTFLELALPSPLRQTFHYIMPAKMSLPALGSRVRVMFGRREMIGICVGLSDHTHIAEEKLRFAEECLDTQPVIDASLLALCRWAASYYHHPLGEVLDAALPVLLRQGEAAEHPGQLHWQATRLGLLYPLDGSIKRAPKQVSALEVLRQYPDGMIPPLLKSLGIERSTLLALEKKGLVSAHLHSIYSAPNHLSEHLREAPLPLNNEQALALAQIHFNHFQSYLLMGVTGSGKTEVYLQAIHQCLSQHKQVLVLVPEIGLTPQTLSRFRARFMTDIVALHSGLNDSERLHAWRVAKNGQAGIIIGTRSAIFTPFAQLGLIIVDEEHDLSFKQQEGFRYHARDIAIRRAQVENIPIVLGSATPALESLHNAELDRYKLLTLTQRAGNAKPPTFKLIDLRQQTLEQGFSPSLLAAIGHTLGKGDQVLVFINRRGYAPVLLCHDCGWQQLCKRCDARPTLHRNPTRLHCHHCGYETAPPTFCPTCGSTDLRPLGVGTERAEDFLQSKFPSYPLFRVDRDSMRAKEALTNLYHTIQHHEPALLVGTQMLAKGHHFPHVTLVAIVDGDSGLFNADFRASEHTSQLIIQVAGRAGRAEKPGMVLLQTHQPEHPLLHTLVTQGYDAFAKACLPERSMMQMPPFGYLTLIRAEANSPDKPLAFLQAAKELCPNTMRCWGPVPAPMERRAGQFRGHLLLQHSERKVLHQALAALVPAVDALPESKRVRWSIDIDPQDLH